MKTLEMRDKISEKLRGVHILITNISDAMRPSVSNFVLNQCLDIVLYLKVSYEK